MRLAQRRASLRFGNATGAAAVPKRGSSAERPLMTAVGGSLLLLHAGLPLGGCALLQHTSARGWAALRPPRAGGRERAPYLSYPRPSNVLVATRHQHHHTPNVHFIKKNLQSSPIHGAGLTLHRGKSVEIQVGRRARRTGRWHTTRS